MNKTSYGIAFAAVAGVCAFACSSSSGTPAGMNPMSMATHDGGPMTTPADAGGDSAGEVVLSGQLVDFSTPTMGLSGSTVKTLSKTATTNAKGFFALNVPTGTPFALTFTDTGYATLTNETTMLSAAYDAGATTAPSDILVGFLLAAISSPAPALQGNLGTVAIVVMPESTCASATGTTFTVGGVGGGGPAIIYTSGSLGLPTPGATSATKGQNPAAIAYNLPVGIPITIAVSGGPCTQDPDPVTQGPVTYQGSAVTVASETAGDASTLLALSFIRVFLK